MKRMSAAWLVSLSACFVGFVVYATAPNPNAAFDPAVKIESAHGDGNLTPYATEDQLRATVVKLSHDNGHGSGVIIGRRDILTNAHVVGDRATMKVTFFDRTEMTGMVAWRDVKSDLALVVLPRPSLHAPAKLSCAADMLEAPQGEVAVVGNPLGLEWMVTRGRLAGIDTSYMKKPAYVLTALVERGNSGGPLFDRYGNVRGIVNALIGAPLLGAFDTPFGYAAGYGLAIPLAEICGTASIRAVL